MLIRPNPSSTGKWQASSTKKLGQQLNQNSRAHISCTRVFEIVAWVPKPAGFFSLSTSRMSP